MARPLRKIDLPTPSGAHVAGPMAPGDLIDDWYVVRGVLGEGSASVVYEATDGVIEDTVAIKVLRSADPGLRARFAAEAHIMDQLRGPAVPKVHVIGQLFDGSSYIVMERVAQTLHERFEAPHLCFNEIFGVGREVLSACAAIHGRGVVHRDIKPANIGLTPGVEGRLTVKLLDFGICFARGFTWRRTTAGMLIGTPEYMPPEQIRAEQVDRRADLYSVGVVLYECITGRLPFQGDSAADTLAAVLRDPIPYPAAIRPECSPALERVVLRALSRSREARYGSAEQMAAALASAERQPCG